MSFIFAQSIPNATIAESFYERGSYIKIVPRDNHAIYINKENVTSLYINPVLMTVYVLNPIISSFDFKYSPDKQIQFLSKEWNIKSDKNGNIIITKL